MYLDSVRPAPSTAREQLSSNASIRLTNELGKVCAVAWNVLHRPDVEEAGRKSQLVAQALRRGKLARHTLTFITGRETELGGYELAGVGRTSVALHNDDRVVKKLFRGAGRSEAWQDAYTETFLHSYEEIHRRLGELCVPTVISRSELTLRPSAPLPTLQFEQPYIADITDVFNAPDDMLSGSVKQNLRYVAETTRALRDQDIWLDILGDENLVLTPDTSSETGYAVRLVDVAPLSSTNLDLKDTTGRTMVQRFDSRLTALDQLAAA